MKEPLVSVLIPAYNHEKYVQETIRSIINQTYKNIEIIVLDDGSKDSTWQKINELKEECEKRFVRVHFETKENEGTCKTLNKLISLSKGEYIYMIASDDISKCNAIEEEMSFLIQNEDYALAACNDEIVDSEGKTAYWDKKRNLVYNKKQAKYLTFKDFLQKKKKVKFDSKNFGTYETLYIDNYILNGFIVRKSVLEIFGGYSPCAPVEDWYLMMQISKYSKMKYIDKVLLSYRWHDSNNIKNTEKMKIAAQKTIDYEEEILQKIDESKVLPDVIKVKKYGSCYKKIGIPFIFQIKKYRKANYKIKQILLFNFVIFSYRK